MVSMRCRGQHGSDFNPFNKLRLFELHLVKLNLPADKTVRRFCGVSVASLSVGRAR